MSASATQGGHNKKSSGDEIANVNFYESMLFDDVVYNRYAQ